MLWCCAISGYIGATTAPLPVFVEEVVRKEAAPTEAACSDVRE
jgi:hypothetical protein